MPVGTYTVTETSRSGEPAGYDFDNSTVTIKTATLTSANAGEVTITNKYKIKELKVTVKKEVNGNMGDTNQEFSFNNGNFKLKNGQEKEFMVKYGEAFTVTETDANKNGYTTSYKVDDGDAKDGGTCTLKPSKQTPPSPSPMKKPSSPPTASSPPSRPTRSWSSLPLAQACTSCTAAADAIADVGEEHGGDRRMVEGTKVPEKNHRRCG